jgi:hypothetical protein
VLRAIVDLTGVDANRSVLIEPQWKSDSADTAIIGHNANMLCATPVNIVQS